MREDPDPKGRCYVKCSVMTLMFLLLSMTGEGQTRLLSVAQKFAINEAANGYTMRANDIQALQHATLDASVNCMDNGNQTSNYISNIVAWWPNIGNSLTSQSYNLISPSTNQITWTGTPTANDGYVTLDGSTQWGSVPYNSGFAANSLTWSCWVNVSSFANTYNSVIEFFDNSFGIAIILKSTGKLAIYLQGSSGNVFYDGTGSHVLGTSTWYNLIVTYDSATHVLTGYVNALLDATVTGVLGSPLPSSIGAKFYIGQTNFPPRLLTGSIQDVMILNGALTSTQVTNTYDWQLNNLGYANKH